MDELILGIDPGSRQTGYALLKQTSGKLRALRCDVIRLAHTDDHSERLQILFDRISRLVSSFEPDACSIETPIYGVDPLAMLKLGRAQAAAMLAITNLDKPVFEYYPKVVKKSITGNGNASKKQVAYMLHKMVTLPEEEVEIE
jgi:crossover junction endodeoxyribonuclease RuvC